MEEKSVWQRCYVTASVFVGLGAAFWAYGTGAPYVIPSYESVAKDYQNRVGATQSAIDTIKATQSTFTNPDALNGRNKAITELEQDIVTAGQQYHDDTKNLTKNQTHLAGIAFIVSLFFGILVGGLIQSLGWVLDGARKRRGITATKATIHAIPLKTTASAPAPPRASPDDPAHPRSS